MAKNILIICGAGASFDYSNYAHPSILTNDLVNTNFINKPEISSIISKYPDMAGIFSEISTPVIENKQTFESSLQKIMDGVGDKKHRKEQFISLEFFLKDTFEWVSKQSNPINNYQALITKIKDYNEGKASVITFNYDSLLEQSITDEKYVDINHYLSNNIQIIKPHGSHDWAYMSDKNNLDYQWEGCITDCDYYKKHPEYLSQLRQIGAHPYHTNQLKNHSNLAIFPAIAVPLSNKDTFVCPERHTLQIKTVLKNADKILIIGWKAGDKILVDLIEKNINKQVPVTIVTEKKESSEEVASNLRHIKNLNFRLVNSGFSGFISSDEINVFFKE